jgi:hypothetical protein
MAAAARRRSETEESGAAAMASRWLRAVKMDREWRSGAVSPRARSSEARAAAMRGVSRRLKRSARERLCRWAMACGVRMGSRKQARIAASWAVSGGNGASAIIRQMYGLIVGLLMRL